MSREDIRKVPLGLTKEFIRPLVLIAIPDRVKEYRAQLAKYETDKKKFEKIKNQKERERKLSTLVKPRKLRRDTNKKQEPVVRAIHWLSENRERTHADAVIKFFNGKKPGGNEPWDQALLEVDTAYAIQASESCDSDHKVKLLLRGANVCQQDMSQFHRQGPSDSFGASIWTNEGKCTVRVVRNLQFGFFFAHRSSLSYEEWFDDNEFFPQGLDTWIYLRPCTMP